MTALLLKSVSSPFVTSRGHQRKAEDGEICKSVRGLLGRSNAARASVDRRQHHRQPYPYPIRLTPFDGELPLEEQTLVGLGKHLSEYGLDFYCQQPLPYRRMIAWFEGNGGPPIGLLLDLTWCRFNKFGWYENGGKFLQVVRRTAAGSLPF